MSLEDYLAELTEGAAESEGRFGIDPVAAFRKQQQFYRQHKHLWLLKMVQAAVGAATEAIYLGAGRNSCWLAYSSPNPPPDLETLLSHPTHQDLRMGLLAALAEGGTEIRWNLFEDGSWRSWKLDQQAHGERVTPALPSRIAKLPLTRLYRAALQIHYGNEKLWQTIPSGLKRRAGLCSTLYQRCEYSPVPIRFSGLTVGGGSTVPDFMTFAREFQLGEFGNDVFVPIPAAETQTNMVEFEETRLDGLEHLNCQLLRCVGKATDYFQATSSPPIVLPISDRKRRLRGQIMVPSGSRSDTISRRKKASFYCQLALAVSNGEYPNSLTLIRKGVVLERLKLSLGRAGAAAIASCPQLKTDVSTLKFVRDDTFRGFVDHLRARVVQLIARALELEISMNEDQREELKRWLQARI